MGNSTNATKGSKVWPETEIFTVHGLSSWFLKHLQVTVRSSGRFIISKQKALITPGIWKHFLFHHLCQIFYHKEEKQVSNSCAPVLARIIHFTPGFLLFSTEVCPQWYCGFWKEDHSTFSHSFHFHAHFGTQTSPTSLSEPNCKHDSSQVLWLYMMCHLAMCKKK